MLSPDVVFFVRCISLAQRARLLRELQHLLTKYEFLRASGGEPADKIETALVEQEITSLYVRWGIERIEGLEVDGCGADVDMLINSGPEDLTNEAACFVREECGLSREEIKN